MSDDADNSGGAAEESEGSIFGKLPDARPGTRSPRRRSASSPGPPAKPTKKRAAPKPQPAADAAKVAAASAPSPASSDVDPAEPSTPPQSERASVEDLAWAGVAAAAEAATLGVRLANRAMEAFRGTSERR